MNNYYAKLFINNNYKVSYKKERGETIKEKSGGKCEPNFFNKSWRSLITA